MGKPKILKDIDNLESQLAEIVPDTTLWYLENIDKMRTKAIITVQGFYNIDEDSHGKYRVVTVDGTETWITITDGINSFKISNNGEIAQNKVLTTDDKKLRYIAKDDKINVKLFGAKGDGIADDTKVIQIAINFAQSNKKSVFFPSSIYGISQTLVVTNAIDISGVGRYSVIKPLNEIPNDNTTEGNALNTEFGAIFRVEWQDAKNDGYYSIETPLDSVSIHDLFIKGDMRKYRCDAIQLYLVDHCKFYNLMIEEIKGSAFKLYQARECFFDNINIRYCGLKHNTGEDEKSKGHPTIFVIPHINDTSNLNIFNNMQIMCSFYTALRTMAGNNRFSNVYFHQNFPLMLTSVFDGQIYSDLLGGMPRNDNNNYMDFDVIQVINRLDSKQRYEYFNQCGAVWGGQTHPMIYVENCYLILTGGNFGGHWSDGGDTGTNTGIGIQSLNSYVYINGSNLVSNYYVLKDLGGSQFYGSNITYFPNDIANTITTNWNLILQQMSNYTKTIADTYSVNKYGGIFSGDRYIQQLIENFNNNTLLELGQRTDLNGHTILEVNKGVLKLGDNAVDITTPWVGMVWKNPSNDINMQTATYGKVTAGESKAFTKGSTTPTSPQEGWVWYDTVNHQFKGWNGTTWVVLG